MNILRDDNLDTEYDYLLLDASGAVIARITFLPGGTVNAFPVDFGFFSSWNRKGQVLSILDQEGRLIAYFNAEGLDDRGRKLIWGSIKMGGFWLEYSLREAV
ncbi:MAG TPA: hypothetical protein VFU15_04720, partial [Bacteroidia bacterium]|nr:hypothetical protein [Bacteroidia bacterium]